VAHSDGIVTFRCPSELEPILPRQTWTARFETIDREAAVRLHETAGAVSREPGTYRRQFRAPKR